MESRDLITDYYRQHRGALLTFVGSRLGGDVMAAEDLVQELFLRLLADERRVVMAATLPSLVRTMALHLVADHYRQRFYRRRHAEQAARADATCTMEPELFARDTMAHIEHRLARLPQPCAQVYRLHLYGGMKAADICRHLGMDYKAVEYRLGQARREVRRLLRSS